MAESSARGHYRGIGERRLESKHKCAFFSFSFAHASSPFQLRWLLTAFLQRVGSTSCHCLIEDMQYVWSRYFPCICRRLALVIVKLRNTVMATSITVQPVSSSAVSFILNCTTTKVSHSAKRHASAVSYPEFLLFFWYLQHWMACESCSTALPHCRNDALQKWQLCCLRAKITNWRRHLSLQL